MMNDEMNTQVLDKVQRLASELFDVPLGGAGGGDGSGVLLGSAQLLAGQPEFATKEGLQGLSAQVAFAVALMDMEAAGGGADEKFLGEARLAHAGCG